MKKVHNNTDKAASPASINAETAPAREASVLADPHNATLASKASAPSRPFVSWLPRGEAAQIAFVDQFLATATAYRATFPSAFDSA